MAISFFNPAFGPPYHRAFRPSFWLTFDGKVPIVLKKIACSDAPLHAAEGII